MNTKTEPNLPTPQPQLSRSSDLLARPWFVWQGKRYEGLVHAGIHLIACPICGDGIPCHGEPRDEMWLPHEVKVAADGAMTVTPSVVCPRKCGWHVTITNGQAA